MNEDASHDSREYQYVRTPLARGTPLAPVVPVTLYVVLYFLRVLGAHRCLTVLVREYALRPVRSR
jgi:hypothetical protein